MAQNGENILLIGDEQRQLRDALVRTLPHAKIVCVESYFDGIAELACSSYQTIFAASEPIERRPQAAISTLRKASNEGRIILFGQPAMEPLTRRMMQYGCDDYIVTPPEASELQQLFETAPLRLVRELPESGDEHHPAMRSAGVYEADGGDEAGAGAPMSELPLAEVFLDAMVQHPAGAPQAIVAQINAMIAPEAKLELANLAQEADEKLAAEAQAGRHTDEQAGKQAGEGTAVLSVPVRVNNQDIATLSLEAPTSADPVPLRHWLSRIAQLIAKATALQDRHNRLQKLAITDDLTGVYNGRYFRHFLTRILERAHHMRFPVTLLLFDIDNFKQYNDRFGHGVGDGILQQTAALMRRCVRDHDLVARIGGDEFAVVFWEKDGPRQPQSPNGGVSGRPPQTPVEIFARFQRLMATHDFPALGPQGVGTLTISGGLAVYPYDASTLESLIEAADKALMLGAKRAGKNSITLVGETPPAQ